MEEARVNQLLARIGIFATVAVGLVMNTPQALGQG